MKTTALNGNMVITDNGGMTIMERIKRYFAENAETITGGFLMMNGGNLNAAYRMMGR